MFQSEHCRNLKDCGYIGLRQISVPCYRFAKSDFDLILPPIEDGLFTLSLLTQRKGPRPCSLQLYSRLHRQTLRGVRTTSQPLRRICFHAEPPASHRFRQMCRQRPSGNGRYLQTENHISRPTNWPLVRLAKDFYGHIIRATEDYGSQVRYLLRNPVRRRLVVEAVLGLIVAVVIQQNAT